MPKIPHLESATSMVCPQVGWQGLHHNLHSPSNPVMAIWGRISWTVAMLPIWDMTQGACPGNQQEELTAA